jgi:leucyl/phenylalanyl-tRNA--protein transferase
MSNQLSADLIIEAYKQGIYPMDTNKGLRWFSPSQRCIIDLENFHVSRRLARKYRQKAFTMKVNTAWNEVLFHCANRENTWINDEIKRAYTELYERGQAHSIEAFIGDKLAGGLYGVNVGGAFMAESMFHLVSDASKFCLVYLVEILRKQQFVLLDTQDFSKHKASFGAIMIPKGQYLKKLGHAISLERQFIS